MAKRFAFRKLILTMFSAGILGFCEYVNAAAFQLWEQDGASIGNYHAGRAAIAEDASTAFYNPAGLVRIKNQQLVLGAVPIITNFKFNGTVDVNTVNTGSTGPLFTSAQGGGFNLVPDIHYAAPINDKLVLGFSFVVPFGLKTDYGQQSFTRYAATLTSLKVLDFSPSFGFAATDKFSVGGGVDIERANAEFDLVAGIPQLSQLFPDTTPATMDTYGQNTGADHAYGYHAGILFQFSPDSRLGVGYNSKVVHVLHGTSKFFGPLANDGLGGVQYSDSLSTKIVLPPTTTISLFHTVNSNWDTMVSVSYTQWNVLQRLVLVNVQGVQTDEDSQNIRNLTVTIPQYYKNTWNYAVGANYRMNEKMLLRMGAGYDQSPSNDQYRNLQLPDSNRIAIALGGHFQANKAIGLDAGWTHVFAINTHINNTLVVGDQSTTVVGSVNGSADVYGFQLTWDLA